MLLTGPRSQWASALRAVQDGASNEFVAFDIREAMTSLAEITGEVTSEELLNHIFGTFLHWKIGECFT